MHCSNTGLDQTRPSAYRSYVKGEYTCTGQVHVHQHMQLRYNVAALIFTSRNHKFRKLISTKRTRNLNPMPKPVKHINKDLIREAAAKA